MFSKIFAKKRITLISLTSLLLVSFCLIPCGKAGLLQAEASSHAGMQHEMAGEMAGNSCHDTASADFQLKEGTHDSCLHCDSSAPAIIQTLKKDFSKDQVVYVTAEYPVSKNEHSNSHLKWAVLMPPGSDRPIHILNSIFII